MPWSFSPGSIAALVGLIAGAAAGTCGHIADDAASSQLQAPRCSSEPADDDRILLQRSTVRSVADGGREAIVHEDVVDEELRQATNRGGTQGGNSGGHNDNVPPEDKSSNTSSTASLDSRFPSTVGELLDRDAERLDQALGMETVFFHGCLAFVNASMSSVEGFDFFAQLEDFTTRCKTGMLIDGQDYPVPADPSELAAECDRMQYQLRLQYRLFGEGSMSIPQRACAVLVEDALPVNNEPECMRFMDEITFTFASNHPDAAVFDWPAILNQSTFGEDFMEACLQDEALVLEAAGEGGQGPFMNSHCKARLQALAPIKNKTFRDLPHLFADVCPILGKPLPSPPAANTSREHETLLTRRASRVKLFHTAAKVANSRWQQRETSAAHTRPGPRARRYLSATSLLDASLERKDDIRRRRRRLSLEESRCCSGKAETEEATFEASAIATISGEYQHGFGFNGWTGDTCQYKEGHFGAYCYGFGADLGIDARYEHGWFDKFDFIEGEACFMGASVAFIVHFGGGVFVDCVDKSHVIGGWMEIGVGIGIDFSVGQCKTHLVSLIQDRNFTDLKPHCPANLACFPADAVVMTPSGDKSMRDLRVGDRVLAVNAYGQAIFDDIYFFGHADPSALAHYVHISARQVLNESDLAVDVAEEMGASDFSLELSPDHFVPACPYRQQPCSWWERKHVYAGGVASGDHIWISPIAGELQLVRVANASFVAKAGMYNPYTLSGSIVVNRMLASAHSSWILDEWTPEALSQYLPGVYQALFFPGRLMYHAAGPYAADVLDMNNPQTRPETYGGGPLFLAACGLVALAALAGAVVGSSKPVGVDNEKHLL